MKIIAPLFLGFTVVVVPPLRAAPQEASLHLQSDQKKLEKMQSNRVLDDEHTQKAQEEMDKGNVELADHMEQLVKDVSHLVRVENQVVAGNKQKALDRKSYKDAREKYGAHDPRCVEAKGTWKESREAMGPLLNDRRLLKENIHDGGRLVHNDKIILGVQKRDMDSGTRYRAQNDRKIKRKEENIEDDLKEMAATASNSNQASLLSLP